MRWRGLAGLLMERASSASERKLFFIAAQTILANVLSWESKKRRKDGEKSLKSFCHFLSSEEAF